jgi:acid phosphatase family membrane protein YuiD
LHREVFLLLQRVKIFFENPVVLCSASSWFFAQFIKALIYILRPRKKRFAREALLTFFWKTGGMPSSHAALVCSMSASVAFNEGVGSNMFAVSFFLAMIVIRDAVGVRRSSGLQARSLNQLGRQAADICKLEFRPVKEVNGHTPLEVAVGGLLGFFTAAAFNYL